MRLFYCRDADGNFGDALNEWIWPRLCPKLLRDDAADLLVGIGTILDQRVPAGVNKRVFGTGTGIGALPVLDQSWQFFCVRGPLTARAIGAPAGLAVTDPAALVADLFPHARVARRDTSVMPHMFTVNTLRTRGIDLADVVTALGFQYIDPYGPIEVTMRALAGSKVVLAEAMHGAIVADAFRVPWIPIQVMPEANAFKWWDWCLSLGLAYEPERFSEQIAAAGPSALARFFERVRQVRQPLLSADDVLDGALARVHERLSHLKGGCDEACCPRADVFVADPDILAAYGGPYELDATVCELRAAVQPDERFILVNDDYWGPEILGEYHPLPFLERNGQPWGPPGDDEQSIGELERMRRAGAGKIAFAWTAFWWLEHYTTFRDYLRSSFRCVAESDRLIVFDLRSRVGGRQ